MPLKSSEFAGWAPLPTTLQVAVLLPAIAPLRCTRKLKVVESVLRLEPSLLSAHSGWMDSVVSSLMMTPVVCLPLLEIVAPTGSERVTKKASSAS